MTKIRVGKTRKALHCFIATGVLSPPSKEANISVTCYIHCRVRVRNILSHSISNSIICDNRCNDISHQHKKQNSNTNSSRTMDANSNEITRMVNHHSSRASNDTALETFMTSLVKSLSSKSVTSVSSAPTSLPSMSEVSIIQDRAKVLERSYSLSFRRAQQKMRQTRRRIHMIDVKKMSRWESYPYARKEKAVEKAKRRKSNSPDRSSGNQKNEQLSSSWHVPQHHHYHDGSSSKQKDTGSHPDFIPCSTWLEIVAKNASYSPKPTPRAFRMIELETDHHNGTKAHNTSRLTPILPLRSTSLDSTDPNKLLKAQAAKTKERAKSPSPRSKRAAALSGAPRRPRRQASLTNVISMPDISLEEQASTASSSRPRRHSDHPVYSSTTGPTTRRHHHHYSMDDAVTRWGEHTNISISNHSSDHSQRRRLPQSKYASSDDDDSEDSFQDATSAEWKEICARSA